MLFSHTTWSDQAKNTSNPFVNNHSKRLLASQTILNSIFQLFFDVVSMLFWAPLAMMVADVASMWSDVDWCRRHDDRRCIEAVISRLGSLLGSNYYGNLLISIQADGSGDAWKNNHRFDAFWWSPKSFFYFSPKSAMQFFWNATMIHWHGPRCRWKCLNCVLGPSIDNVLGPSIDNVWPSSVVVTC